MSHEVELLQRAADALGQLPVRGLVTTGPAVDPAAIRAPASVSVRRWVRHADVLPACSAVLTHGGHGTVIKALAAGVPLVVAPLGRDQPDNAARVVYAGAGLRVSRKASVADLRNALGRVLEEPRFLTAARRMAAILAAERDEGLVVDELEQTALEGTANCHAGRADLRRVAQRRELADHSGGGDAVRGVAARYPDRVAVRRSRHDQPLVLVQRFGRSRRDQLGDLADLGRGHPSVKGSRVPPVSSTQMAFVTVYSCTASMPFSRPSPLRPNPPNGTSGPTTR